MWPFKRSKGRHRKPAEASELFDRLEKATDQHGRESWKVAAKATRLTSAADRMIASNRQALQEAAHGERT